MANFHFISYSRADDEGFALKLCDALKAGPPAISAWVDKRELKPGMDWDGQIVEAIRSCDSLIFVMTRDSVQDQSVCKDEWTRALKYKKTIIPLLLHADAETPFRLENRQYIDFSGDFETGLAQLRRHLQWLPSPKGRLQALKDRLKDAQRALQRADDPLQQGRIKDEIETLKKDIAIQEKIAANPQAAAQRVQQSIERGLERERQPQRRVSGKKRSKFINPPPGIAPAYFQGRHTETKLLGDFLKDEAVRLITAAGRAGIGKTALVCRLLKAVESGNLPDGGGPLEVNGILYLGEMGAHKVNFPNLFSGLCKLLPRETAEKLELLYKEPQISSAAKMQQLLAAFPQGRVLVLLDNFDLKLDTETREISDGELDEALQALLKAQHHGVKIIITTRIAPRGLTLVQPGRQCRLDLDKGLESPFAENILRAMDKDGKLGLKNAADKLLDRARERTLGYPRALEALFAILSADRETSLQDILNDAEHLLPEHVVEKLVGEAFSRLDTAARMVMQALAVYGRAVPPPAIDYLLQPYLPGVDSAPVLNRLLNMQFASKEEGRFYLHPVDADYAGSRVPAGNAADRDRKENPPFTQLALLHRGADYFKEARLPRKEWQSITDLEPQLAEFDLRFAGKDFDTAARILLDIDFDYLLLWGHLSLMAELHERLLGKISDAELEQMSVGNLGSAYYSMGQLQKAISCYEKALQNARKSKNRQGEGGWLGNLGTCFSDLGQIDRAIEYYEQGLQIQREIGDQKGEAIKLGNLGLCYADLGQIDRAIEYLEQALTIDRETGYRQGEATRLGNLGTRYFEIGQTDRAIEYLEQALAIDRETGYRQGEAIRRGNLGEAYACLRETDKAFKYFEESLSVAREIEYRLMVAANLAYIGDILVDRRKMTEAIQNYNQAIRIADDIARTKGQNEGRYCLALAYLYSGNLGEARKAVQEAGKYSYPPNDHNVHTLTGLIQLRRGKPKAAQAAFKAALAEAERLLGYEEKNYRALDSKALSLCGLCLCRKKEDRVPEAVKAFKAARAINKDAGYLDRLSRLFAEFARVDSAGLLNKARQAISAQASKKTNK